jgi:hypothetical protein
LLVLICKLAGVGRYLQVRCVGYEAADFPIEREAVRALADADDEHGRRPVNGIAGSHLPEARLQVVGSGRRAVLLVPQHREDGAHRNVDVGVRGAIERIEREQVAAAGVLRRHCIRLLELLGHHAGEQPAPLAAADHDLVGQHVELLLGLALHVLAAVLAEVAAERPLGRHGGDGLDGGRHVDQQRPEVLSPGDAGELLNQELGERGAPEVHWRDSLLMVLGGAGLEHPAGADIGSVDRSSGPRP